MKLAPPKEEEDHIALEAFLRVAISPQWRYTHIPAGGKRDIRTAVKLQRMGTKPGFPDFVFVHQSGAVWWLELKRRSGGRLSPAQQDMRSFLMRGGNYFMTTDIRDAIDQLRDLGIVRASVSA